jgi:hypothetical protein
VPPPPSRVVEVDRQHRAPRAPTQPERRQEPPEPAARLASAAVSDVAAAAGGGNGKARAGLPAAAGSWFLFLRLPAEPPREAVHGEGARDGLLRDGGGGLGREPAGAPVPDPRRGVDDAPRVAAAELQQVAAGGVVVVAREHADGGDDGAAERAADVVVEPGVDAVDVEGVGAAGQQLEPLPGRELAQAHGALGRGPRPAAVVPDDGQRGDYVRVEPARELSGIVVGEEDRGHALRQAAAVVLAARAVEQAAGPPAAEPAADHEEVVADEDERGDHEPDRDDDGDRERRRRALPRVRRRWYWRACRRVHRQARARDWGRRSQCLREDRSASSLGRLTDRHEQEIGYPSERASGSAVSLAAASARGRVG